MWVPSILRRKGVTELSGVAARWRGPSCKKLSLKCGRAVVCGQSLSMACGALLPPTGAAKVEETKKCHFSVRIDSRAGRAKKGAGSTRSAFSESERGELGTNA